MKNIKRQHLISAIISGILLFAAWPEKGFAPLLFIAFIPLLSIEDFYYRASSGRKNSAVFSLSYLTFFIWNLLTTWWIYHATFFGAASAIIVNSFFMAVVFTLFHFTHCKTGSIAGYISLAAYWLSFEYIHLAWEFSWPWLNLGNGFASYYKWIQWYEYTGALSGSLWILIVNILLFKIFFHLKYQTESRKPETIITIIIIAIPIVYSLIRYNSYKETINPVNIAVVQPNIDPYTEKFSGLSPRDQLVKLLRLSGTVTDSATDYLVAPETAMPSGMWEEEIQDHPDVKFLRSFMQKHPKLTVIIGAATNRLYKNAGGSVTARKFTKSAEYYDSYNTALQLDNFSDSVQIYHKSKLVPGVERMPYPGVLGYLDKFAIDLGGMSGSLGTDAEPKVFTSHDSVKIAPVICYESIYGSYISDYIKKGAQLIFIITNDGWWNNSPGHRQHLQYARLRAIEMRRSIARSANTGISCFINQRGDISRETKYGQDDAIRETINANDKMTFYAKHGDSFFKIFLLASVLLIIYSLYKKFKK